MLQSSSLPAIVPSPLYDNGEADRIGQMPASHIVDTYRRQFDIDVSRYFSAINEIGLYQCRRSGFKFYFPVGLAGEGWFYDALEQKIPEYYDETKWEHDLAASWIKPPGHVLDIGCGRGSFLTRARDQGMTITGLESNVAAAGGAAERGIEIFDEHIEEHAQRRPGHYDVVAAFQVLEHVPDPRQFLYACKTALKPGGMLIVGVPNDDGFIGMDRSAVLNAPPHHLTLWDRRSLTALAELLEMDLIHIEAETLHHPAWFQATVETKYVPAGWRRRLWYKLGAADVLRRAIEENAAGIAGHTIIAAYSKPR